MHICCKNKIITYQYHKGTKCPEVIRKHWKRQHTGSILRVVPTRMDPQQYALGKDGTTKYNGIN